MQAVSSKYWLFLAGHCNIFVTRGPLIRPLNQGKVFSTNTMTSISEADSLSPRLERKASRRARFSIARGTKTNKPSRAISQGSIFDFQLPSATRAFTLIELLAVMAIIAIMLTLMLPAITGFSSTAGRRGAINSLMNAFEQARVAALETGTTVYVVLRRNTDPNEQDSFLICRERSDDMGDAAGTAYIPIFSWQKLPKGIHFFPASNTLLTTGGAGNLPANLTTSLLPGNVTDPLFAIGFNNRSQIVFPLGEILSLYLGESIKSISGERAKGASIAVTERISFRRYTGRAQLDFAAPPST
jgi:prepilin-type N-terminal cleavage/methylation domain-containing protein